CTDEDGNPLLPQPIVLNLPARQVPAEYPHGWDLSASIVINLTTVPINKPGFYNFEILIDDQQVRTLPFRAVKAATVETVWDPPSPPRAGRRMVSPLGTAGGISRKGASRDPHVHLVSRRPRTNRPREVFGPDTCRRASVVCRPRPGRLRPRPQLRPDQRPTRERCDRDRASSCDRDCGLVRTRARTARRQNVRCRAWCRRRTRDRPRCRRSPART